MIPHLSNLDRGLYIGTYTFGIGTYDRYLSQRDRYLSGWKEQGGPRATYFLSPLHQDCAMIYVSREMFTIGARYLFEQES